MSIVSTLQESLRGKPKGDWMRRKELKAATGMSEVKLAEAIEIGIHDGLIEVKKIGIPDVSGKLNWRPVYRMRGKK